MWKLEFLFIALLIRFSRRAMRAANHRPFQLNSIENATQALDDGESGFRENLKMTSAELTIF